MDIQPGDSSSFQNFIVWENGFTRGELDAIEAAGDALALQKATVQQGDANLQVGDPVRSSFIGALGRQPETSWLYERLERIVRTVNDQVYRYDLVGFSEPLQYTVYTSQEEGHYGWHVDQLEAKLPRKLSFSLQLTEPDGYEGCDLEIFNGGQSPMPAPRDRGVLIVFPSYAMHRVTQIRAGTRKALVFWVCGPYFR